MKRRPRRRLDYEALAYASILLEDYGHARSRLQQLGVDKPTSHEARLFHRAVYRIRARARTAASSDQ